MLLSSQPAAEDLTSFLEAPLDKKLPVGWPCLTQAASMCGADILNYVIEDNGIALCARDLSRAASLALCGPLGGLMITSEYGTAFQAQMVVDTPLLLAARALGLSIRVDRNVQDKSNATGKATRGGRGAVRAKGASWGGCYVAGFLLCSSEIGL